MKIPPWMITAFQECGVHETRNSDRVEVYWSELGFGPENFNKAWCTVFASWVLKVSGMRYLRTSHARDYLKYGCVVFTHEIQFGDLLVFARGSRTGTQGHNGFYMGSNINEGLVYSYGGNQGDMVCIRPYRIDDLLGIRRPIAKEIVRKGC